MPETNIRIQRGRPNNLKPQSHMPWYGSGRSPSLLDASH